MEPTAELFKKEERYFKQVYSIQANMPIAGLRMEQFPASLRKYVVVAVTPTRIYQFIGTVSPNNSNGIIEDKAMFESLFSKYEVNPGMFGWQYFLLIINWIFESITSALEDLH